MTWTADRIAKLLWTVMALLVALESSIIPAEAANDPGYMLLSGLGPLFLVFWWFLADTRERNIPATTALKIAVILLPVFAIPYYRFRKTGFRNGVLFVGKVLGLTLAVVAFGAFVDWLWSPVPPI